LYGYCGFNYASNNKNYENSIEAIILKHLGADLVDISRSATTEQEVSCSRMVVSLVANVLPDIDILNAAMPPEIRIFKIIQLDRPFSARLNCEAITAEILIPSYVFSSPPEATGYCYPPVGEPDEDFEFELESGGLFTTLGRGVSISRRRTLKKAKTTAITEQHQAKKPSFLRKVKSIFQSSKKSGSSQLKSILNLTLNRKGVIEEKDDDSSIVRTLQRSLQRSEKNDISELAKDSAEENGLFDPLDIPSPSEKELESLKAYRLPDSQYNNIRRILSMFNGSHNWHNYIPNSDQTDPRNYMRVIQVDTAPLEIHHGLEWVRMKIQAQKFAKYQLHRMVGIFF
jgi:tRNA pseudouridine(38-40) synthase